jgi:hypothetical protein
LEIQHLFCSSNGEKLKDQVFVLVNKWIELEIPHLCFSSRHLVEKNWRGACSRRFGWCPRYELVPVWNHSWAFDV